MQRLQLRIAVIVTVVSSLSFAAEPGVTATEIKLGTTQPMTGPLAFYGEMTKGSRAYFQSINEDGGVNGRKITYAIEDDAYTPAKTVPATKKLVEQEKVFGLFQALGFPHTSVAPYLKQKKVPSFFLSDGSAMWESNTLAFRGMVPWAKDGAFMGGYVASKYAGKTVGFLIEKSNLGNEGLEAAKKALGDKVKYGPIESYEPGAINADTQTQNLMAAKVDVVIALAVPNVTASAAKYAVTKGWKPAWMVSYVNCAPELVMLGGEAVEGMMSGIFMKLPTDDDASVKEHQKLLDKAFPGTKASFMTLYGQTNAELMVEALRRGGKNLTRQSAIAGAESIKDFTCSLCLFPSTLSATDHTPFEELTPMQVKAGKWTKI